jgi:hypothetical protein
LLAFESTRDENVRDRGLRIRINIPLPRARELHRQSRMVMPPTERLNWQPALLGLLADHHGETGRDEDALEVVRRLSQAWRESYTI